FVGVAAIATSCTRRIFNRPSSPAHSMRARAASVPNPRLDADRGRTTVRAAERTKRTLCLIPAYNEAANLPIVIGEVRVACPTVDILVVDDGSTDSTADVEERLGVRWLRFHDRMGIGSEMRAGLRYADVFGCGEEQRQ